MLSNSEHVLHLTVDIKQIHSINFIFKLILNSMMYNISLKSRIINSWIQKNTLIITKSEIRMCKPVKISVSKLGSEGFH